MCITLRIRGLNFQSYSRLPHAANVIIRDPSSIDFPARIVEILLYTPATAAHTSKTTSPPRITVIFQRYKAKPPGQHDPYKEFGFVVAGGLFRDDCSELEFTDMENIVTHFGKTPYRGHPKDPAPQGLIHVLPLYKVLNVHNNCGRCD